MASAISQVTESCRTAPMALLPALCCRHGQHDRMVLRRRCESIEFWTCNSRRHSLTIFFSCANIRPAVRRKFDADISSANRLNGPNEPNRAFPAAPLADLPAAAPDARAIACPSPGRRIQNAVGVPVMDVESRDVTASIICWCPTCRRLWIRCCRTNPVYPTNRSRTATTRTCPTCRCCRNFDPRRGVHSLQKPRPAPPRATRPWMY